jgi:hypothetical protein
MIMAASPIVIANPCGAWSRPIGATGLRLVVISGS